MSELMSKIVARLNASTGEVVGLGECVGYLAQPSYLIREVGTPGAIHWAESITRAATAEEELRYWQNKAERLESLLIVGGVQP